MGPKLLGRELARMGGHVIDRMAAMRSGFWYFYVINIFIIMKLCIITK